MTVLSRAILSIRRKKIKTLIMFLIMGIVFSGIAGGISLDRTMASLKNKADENINSAISLEGKGKAFSQKDADKLLELSNVKKYNYQYNQIAKIDKKLVANKNANIDIGDAAKEHQNAAITGILRSHLYPQFLNEAFELVKGRHIKKGAEKVALIHETFAKKNHLTIGDKFKLKRFGREITITVLGVYRGNDKTQGALPSEMVENNIFTDLKTAQRLDFSKNKVKISIARYFTDSPKSVGNVIKEAKQKDLPWKTLKIKNDNEVSNEVTSSLDNIQRIIKLFMAGLGVTSILILSFVMIFWIRSRINEIGILISVGISKSGVIKQMILELLMIGTVSLVSSFAVSKLIAEKLGRVIVNLSGSANTGLNLKGLMHNNLSASEYGLLCLLGIGVILISVLIACVPIARQKPKEILSQMN